MSTHRLLVAEVSGDVVGWACSSRLRPRPAYDMSVETSVYLDPAVTGHGLGWWDVRWYERPLP